MPLLLNALLVEDEEILPNLWHQLVNADKKQDFMIIRDALETFAASDDSFTEKAPIISNKLKDDLLTFTWHGTSRDDFETGLSPFAIMDGNDVNQAQNLKLAKTYGLLTSSEIHFNYADLQLLEEEELRSLPLTYFELKRTLGMFGNLLAVILGSGHPLMDAYDQFWYLLNSVHEDLLYQIIDTPMVGQYVKPVHILRSVQLITYNWFMYNKVQTTRVALPTVNYALILHQLAASSYELPHLPPTLYKLANPVKSGPLSMTTVSTASLSLSKGGSSGGHSIAGSDVSSLTTPTTKTGRGTFQANTYHADRTLQSLVPGTLTLKHLIGDTTLPMTEDAQPEPICLAYQFRHGCWTGCNCACTHRKLSESEKKTLANYATDCMAIVNP